MKKYHAIKHCRNERETQHRDAIGTSVRFWAGKRNVLRNEAYLTLFFVR